MILKWILKTQNVKDALGDLVLSVLAVGHNCRVFKPGRGQWIVKATKICRKSKAVGSMP